MNPYKFREKKILSRPLKRINYLAMTYRNGFKMVYTAEIR